MSSKDIDEGCAQRGNDGVMLLKFGETISTGN
jgi:hypothetical protein